MKRRGTDGSQISFCIADVILDFSISDERLADIIEKLLRYHACPDRVSRTESSPVLIELISCNFGEEKKLVSLKEPGYNENHWVWGIPDNAAKWLPERFYYRILFPILSRVFPRMNVARLHSALLFEDSTGVTLILGDRGAGKSSTAAAWLESGGSISCDDTVLLRNLDGEMRCYGIHRELHVDRNLAKHLPGLSGLAQATEYLPGAGRVAYDWLARFPQQCVNSLGKPERLILSCVDLTQPTTVRRLTVPELASAIDKSLTAEGDNALLPDNVKAFVTSALIRAQGWEVKWGPDIWSLKGKHLTFMRGLSSEGLAS